MEFKVTIDQFEGPLDLMLHLIKENKLDLFDLDMNVLASQYIDYIQKMEEIHLEIASEYLEELASLVEYKSRKLLPRNDVEVTQDYEEDQRDKLVNRLLEYQRYKEASEFLKEEFDKRQKLYTRPQASIVSSWQSQPVLDSLEKQSPYDLLKAMFNIGKVRCLMGENIMWPNENEFVARVNFAIDKNALIHNFYQINRLVEVLKDE